MANLYNLCRKDGTVMEYSITASDIAKRIGCDRQDMIKQE
nr:MAG TPA: winged helix-turn-helix DNA-binding protein [Caudoviricetes sp.]